MVSSSGSYPERRGLTSTSASKFAVCPGGEGAVLKTVGCKSLAGSNPVHSAKGCENNPNKSGLGTP